MAQAYGVFNDVSGYSNRGTFLVDRDGKVVSRHAPTTKPEQLRKEIEELLG